jgi:hypothetical protein
LGLTKARSLPSAVVLGDFMKRLFNGAVLLLAALTFFLVPVGRRTPAQHVLAIFTTPPAREAAAALADAAHRAAARARAEFASLRQGSGSKPRSGDAPAR